MWRGKLLEFAETELHHPAWGDVHSGRVLGLAHCIGDGMSLDDDVLFAAAYLHDVGAFPAYRADGIDHAVRSVELAPEILESVGFPHSKVDHVVEVIAGHMFYSRPGVTEESRVFHDADVLDFMGAVGIARIFSIVGLDDWTPEAIDAANLVRRFTQVLPESLVTETGRRLGVTRAAEMSVFIEALVQQTDEFRSL